MVCQSDPTSDACRAVLMAVRGRGDRDGMIEFGWFEETQG